MFALLAVPSSVIIWNAGTLKDRRAVALLGAAFACLAGQHLFLMPKLSERADMVLEAEDDNAQALTQASKVSNDAAASPLPPSNVHRYYIGLEASKLAALLSAGLLLLRQAR